MGKVGSVRGEVDLSQDEFDSSESSSKRMGRMSCLRLVWCKYKFSPKTWAWLGLYNIMAAMDGVSPPTTTDYGRTLKLQP